MHVCSDGELYAGISSDFLSHDTAFIRSLGERHAIRTEQYDSTWLQGDMCMYNHTYTWASTNTYTHTYKNTLTRLLTAIKDALCSIS